MRAIARDIALAARRLTGSPRQTAAAVAVLALGIGATTAIFSVLEGVLLRPLPFAEAERLVVLTRPGTLEADVSIADGADLRESTTTLEEMALFLPFWSFDWAGRGEPLRLVGSPTEPELFEVLGVEALRGRLIGAEDNRLGGPRVAVIAEGFWRRQLGADPGAVGSTLRLNGETVTVIGVVPDHADFLSAGVDLWVPAAVELPWAWETRGTNNFEVVARLADDVLLDAARDELRALSEGLAEQYPRTNQGKILEPRLLLDALVGDLEPRLWLSQLAVAVVLLIACANLAQLGLAAGLRRERGLAVHLALGGSRAAILRQALIESGLTAALGGALGLVVAALGIPALLALLGELPRGAEVGLYLPVLFFAAATTLVAGLFFGLLPAAWAARRDPAVLLGRGGRGATRGARRLFDLSVIGQVALALSLLVVSGLLLRAFQDLRATDPGFSPGGAVTANLVLPENRYGELPRQTAAFQGILDAVEAIPGVSSAAFVIGAPLTEFGSIGHAVRFADRPPPADGEEAGARNRPVLGPYFETLGIPLLGGRAFSPADDAEAPRVAIVNERFARRHWPDGEALGERVAWRLGDEIGEWMTVVGVVGDVRTLGLGLPEEVTIYTPWLQRQHDWQRFGTVVARGDVEPSSLAAPLRAAVWSVDPALPVPEVTPMQILLRRSVARERLSASLGALSAAIALLLALQGLYGLLSREVARRGREIGIRMSLGASPSRVVREILRRGLARALVGTVVGVVGAIAAARWIASAIPGVGAADPWTVVAVTALLVAAAAAASWLPARRAARLDPAVALRQE